MLLLRCIIVIVVCMQMGNVIAMNQKPQATWSEWLMSWFKQQPAQPKEREVIDLVSDDEAEDNKDDDSISTKKKRKRSDTQSSSIDELNPTKKRRLSWEEIEKNPLINITRKRGFVQGDNLRCGYASLFHYDYIQKLEHGVYNAEEEDALNDADFSTRMNERFNAFIEQEKNIEFIIPSNKDEETATLNSFYQYHKARDMRTWLQGSTIEGYINHKGFNNNCAVVAESAFYFFAGHYALTNYSGVETCINACLNDAPIPVCFILSNATAGNHGSHWICLHCIPQEDGSIVYEYYDSIPEFGLKSFAPVIKAIRYHLDQRIKIVDRKNFTAIRKYIVRNQDFDSCPHKEQINENIFNVYRNWQNSKVSSTNANIVDMIAEGKV